jgi:phosphotransferase system IIB component
MTNEQIIILSISLSVVLISTLITIFVGRQNHSKKSEVKEYNFSEIAYSIIDSLGGKTNIISVEKTSRRVSFNLKDIKLIDNDKLKSLGFQGSLSLSQITLFFSNNNVELFDSVVSIINEI